MRKSQGKEKQLAISQKVKKMFTYSPSYQAKKCCSKLPLRYSNAANKNIEANIQKNNELNCQYSSVKQKHLDTNQCNDTSSWIAKLVNGIQDDDEENKMFHRLSQIENKSINDLPEDSQDYDCYNEFIWQKADSLFTQNSKQSHAVQPIFEKQTPITKPMKKSIKQAMIEIQMRQNTDGLKGPPVTRDSSITKRENRSKTIQEKQSQPQKAKITPRKSQIRSSFSTVKSRASLLSQKPKSQAKSKAKTTLKNKEQTFDQIIAKDPSSQLKRSKPKKLQKIDQTTDCGTNKNSMLSTGTKRQTLHRVRYQTQECPTRKNSYLEGTQFEDKFQLKIPDNFSKNLDMKNLFDEQKQFDSKPGFLQKLESEILVSKSKRVGSIKKNKTNVQNKENMKSYHSNNDFIDPKLDTKRTVLNQHHNSILMDSNRNMNNFTLNRKNFEENVLVQLSSNRIRSYRCNIIQSLDTPKILPSNQHQISIPVTKNETYYDKNKENSCIKNEIYAQKINIEIVRCFFDKIRLNQTNQILSKKNLKLRGLTDEEKTQLGSIITKIHYQNAEYDFETFLQEFVKTNMQCSLKGCLSQQNQKKSKVNESEKEPVKIQVNQQLLNHQNSKNEDEPSFFEKSDNAPQISAIIQVIDHRMGNSNLLKKKLFDEINRISYLEEIASDRLEKNSQFTLSSQEIENNSKERNIDENSFNENDQFITKDPYIEGPSLGDIRITKRDSPSHRTAESSENGQQNNKVNLGFSTNFENIEDQNGVCLIQRLNRKLTTYIDKNQIISTYRQFNLNFSELKKHIR